MTKHCCKAFSLIEILVVILIIGIISSVTFFAFGDFGESRKIKLFAQQFCSYIKLLQQKAIIENKTFGIMLKQDTYATYLLNDKLTWSNLNNDDLLKTHAFPKGLNIKFSNYDSRVNNLANSPNIIVYPSGYLTKFVINFNRTDNSTVISLIGNHNGDLKLQNKA